MIKVKRTPPSQIDANRKSREGSGDSPISFT